MTVYVVHEIKDDISPAQRFGELRYVNRFYVHGDELDRMRLDIPGTDDGVSVKYEDVNIIPRGYLANMERCRSEFRFGQDYLLIAGDHLQLLALTALLVGHGGFVDVLRWDRQLRDYIPVRLSSGIVPPRAAMLVSGTDIGDKNAEETRRNAQAVALESPLVARFDPVENDTVGRRFRAKPPSQDDH